MRGVFCFSMVLSGILLVAGGGLAGEEPSEEIERLRSEARRLAGEDRSDRAAALLAEAHSLAPGSAEVLGDLLALSRERPEQSALWALHLGECVTDEKGAFAPPPGLPRKLGRGLHDALKISRARASAVERLAGIARRLRGVRSAATARYLLGLSRVLSEGSPSLAAKHLPTFEAAVEQCRADRESVVEELKQAMDRALREGRDAEAMRGAAILRGLLVQAGRTEEVLGGRKALLASALKVMARVRKSAREAKGPLSVGDLLAIPAAERPKWEAEHSDWADPTVVLSTTGRYRIESTCGLRTTAMAAADVEHQHARLVRWFGTDPFLAVGGVVRLCRTPADLEGQGQPYWWAGGFQSGNTTVLVVNASDRRAIAGLLTHELTHRFDGAVYGGLPKWLLEGRAVFTRAGTLWPRSESVEGRVVLMGSLYQASVRGYGRAVNLQSLIEGTIEEPRDNYPVGYSLWVYLTRRRKGLHGKRIEPYMQSFAATPGEKPMARFERFFMDGKEGRPGKFEDFAADFSRFVREAASLDDFPWKTVWRAQSRSAYAEANRREAALDRRTEGRELESTLDRRIFDHSNWPLIRKRSDDPAFGERHAYAAGSWLAGQGREKVALVAFAWAREVDELTPEQLTQLAVLHGALADQPAAWLLALAARTGGPWSPAPGPVPAKVRPIHRALRPLLAAWEELEAGCREKGWSRVARALLADRARLARRAGLPVRLPSEGVAPAGRELPPADCGPYHGILAGEIVEERWAPADTRIRGNWFREPPALLILGRRQAWKEISGNVRDAGVRRVFVRGTEWFEGSYTLRVKVRLVSAHVSASIVLGHSRHDRGMVVRLRGGDFAYAVGRKDRDAGFRGIHVSLDDLRSYDRGVSPLGRYVPFEVPRTSFLLTVRVSGDFVRVRVGDRDVLSHRTTAGVPVSGRVGFHLGSGLIAFENPAVRRHRAVGWRATCPCEHADAPIDLGRVCSIPWESWPGRRVVGIEKDPLGTLLLCYSRAQGEAWLDRGAVEGTMAFWRVVLGEGEEASRVRVVHPRGDAALPEEVWRDLLPASSIRPHAGLPTLAEAARAGLKAAAVRRAARVPGLSEEEALDLLEEDTASRVPWLAIDPRGVIRSHALGTESWRGWGRHRALFWRLRGF